MGCRYHRLPCTAHRLSDNRIHVWLLLPWEFLLYRFGRRYARRRVTTTLPIPRAAVSNSVTVCGFRAVFASCFRFSHCSRLAPFFLFRCPFALFGIWFLLGDVKIENVVHGCRGHFCEIVVSQLGAEFLFGFEWRLSFEAVVLAQVSHFVHHGLSQSESNAQNLFNLRN